MMAALILVPPVTLGLVAWIISATELPQPWGTIVESGVVGAMALVFYKLTNRLLDEIREIRTVDRERFDTLVTNNTQQLALNREQLADLNQTLQEMKKERFCVLRDEPPPAAEAKPVKARHHG